jgi:hypothetical protein
MIDFKWRLYRNNKKKVDYERGGGKRGKKNSKRSLDGCVGFGRSPPITHPHKDVINPPPVSNLISLRLHDADETTWLRQELGKSV